MKPGDSEDCAYTSVSCDFDSSLIFSAFTIKRDEKNGHPSRAGDDQSVCAGCRLCQGASETVATSGSLAIRSKRIRFRIFFTKALRTSSYLCSPRSDTFFVNKAAKMADRSSGTVVRSVVMYSHVFKWKHWLNSIERCSVVNCYV